MQSAVNDVAQMSESSLALAKDRLERIFGSIELSSLQLAADPLVKNSFFDSDAKDKILAHLDILKLLQVAKGSNDFIEDVILYDDASEDILNNEHGFVLKKMYKLRPVLDYLMLFEPKDQCLLINQPFMESTLACVRYLAPSDINKARGLLITKLNKELVQKYLEVPSVYSAKQSMLVLDSSNHVLVRAGQYFQNEDAILNDSSIQAIIRSGKVNDSFVMKDATGKQFYFSFRKTELGRTYISKIAEADIAEHMSWIRWVLVLTLLLCINIGIAVTVFASLKAYRPIRQLVELGEKLNQDNRFKVRSDNDISFIQDSWMYLTDQAQKINHYMQKWEPTIKESYYLELLEYRNYENKAPVSTAAEHQDQVCAVMMVHLENMHKETRFQRGDGPILSFIVKNVMSEMLQKQERMEGEVVINRSGLGTALIFFPRGLPDSERKGRLTQFASSLVHAFNSYLNLNISIGIGGIAPSLEEIPNSYTEALEALQYRLYEEQDQVLFFEDLETHKKQASFYYPFYIEEALIENLENRRLKEAEENLNDYLLAVRSSKSHVIISQCYYLLLCTMCKSLIRKGYSHIYDHKLLCSLQERKTSVEVYDWFINHIFPFFDKSFETPSHIHILIQKVIQYIDEHVYEDISLGQCAEMAGISPSHLSKSFKKEVGMQFLDYVLKSKINEAQHLLLTTGLSIKEIAEKIGYSERSLIRMFQKHIYMTPSQFRTSHQQ